MQTRTKARKKIKPNTINPIYSVNVYESVNLDDGDSAIVESPFLFSALLLQALCHPEPVEGSLFVHCSTLPRLATADGLFLFAVKKKQKTPAENFSLEVSGMAGSVEPKKFIRPELSRTEIFCCGLAGWKGMEQKITACTTNSIYSQHVDFFVPLRCSRNDDYLIRK